MVEKDVVVGNAPPTVAIGSLVPGADDLQVSAPVVLSGSIDDLGPDDTHTVSVDLGDGTVEPVAVTQRTWSAAHTYGTAGPATITVTVTDDDGDSGGASQGVTVAAAPDDEQGSNRPPEVVLPSTVDVVAGEIVDVEVTTVDPDGDEVTLSLVDDAGGRAVLLPSDASAVAQPFGLSSFLAASAGGGTSTLRFVAGPDDAGSAFDVTVRAFDGQVATPATMSVTVLAPQSDTDGGTDPDQDGASPPTTDDGNGPTITWPDAPDEGTVGEGTDGESAVGTTGAGRADGSTESASMPSSGQLPRTGVALVPLVVLSWTLVLVGTALVLVPSRRRARSTRA